MQILIHDSDLKVEALWPPDSKGGQHVGMPSVPIKVTHLPSGLIAIVESERSQHRNRNIAIEMIIGGLTSRHYQGR